VHWRHAPLFGALLAAALLLLPAVPGYPGGSREESGEAAVLTEAESRDIEVYVLHRPPGSSAAGGVPRPAGQAAWYLFREVGASGGTVSASGERRFSGPVRSRDQTSLRGDLQVTRFHMSLEPQERRSYRNPREIELRFSTNELLSGGQMVLQPAQLAIVKAARSLGGGQRLMRVKSITRGGGGQWEAIVEAAEEVL